MINQEINVKYHNMTKTRKFIKKIQKKSGEDGCSRMYRHRGGWVSLVHENTRNGVHGVLQCSTTVCSARILRCRWLQKGQNKAKKGSCDTSRRQKQSAYILHDIGLFGMLKNI